MAHTAAAVFGSSPSDFAAVRGMSNDFLRDRIHSGYNAVTCRAGKHDQDVKLQRSMLMAFRACNEGAFRSSVTKFVPLLP